MTSTFHSSAQPSRFGAPASAAVLRLETGTSPGASAAGQNPFRSLLLLRFALFNLATFALLTVAWTQGWIARCRTVILRGDQLFLFTLTGEPAGRVDVTRGNPDFKYN